MHVDIPGFICALSPFASLRETLVSEADSICFVFLLQRLK
jgi:hypothetical protein